MVKRFLLPVVVCGLLVAATASLAFMGSSLHMGGSPPSGGGGGGGGGSFFCQYGQTPFVGTVPAAAAAAGFNTCAYNGDFSSSFYATASNFLDCSNSNGAVMWHFYTGSCNLTQVNDGTISKNVMRAENSVTSGASTMAVISWNDGTHFISFPNMYWEIVARMTPASISAINNSGGPASMFACQTDGIVSDVQPDAEEVDPFELYTNQNHSTYRVGNAFVAGCGGPSSGSSWQSFNPPTNIPSSCPNITTYCTYAMLVTSDGSTGQNVCLFVNDTLMAVPSPGTTGNCLTFTPSSTKYLHRWLLTFWVQIGAAGGTVQDEYIQYNRVWTCANWGPTERSPFVAANHCNGTTNSTQSWPTGGTLTYWH